MGDKLKIHNFQAHAKLTIGLDAPVTTVVGGSDVGKSAVVRALRWLATNRPGGDSFIRDGENSVSVELRIDGHTICRAKNGRQNTYAIDGKELTAFGADVPDDVAGVLRLGDTNFQSQHDAPFWFAESAGEVSRRLNQIINLGAIDTTLAALTAAGRRAGAELVVCTDRLAAAREQKKGLAWAKDADAALRQIEAEDDRLAELEGRTQKLRDAIDAVRRNHEALTEARKFKKAVDTLYADAEAWNRADAQRERLAARVDEARALTRAAERPVPAAGGVDAAWGVWRAASDAANALRGHVGRLRAAQGALRAAEKTAAEADARFHTMLGEVCPLCGSPTR